jgi:hypothetical protein
MPRACFKHGRPGALCPGGRTVTRQEPTMPRTLEEIDADIAEVRKAEREFLLGRRPQSMKHGEREISFGSNFAETRRMLTQELFKLRTERARLTGEAAPGRPIYL